MCEEPGHWSPSRMTGSTFLGLKVNTPTFFDAFQYLHCVNISGQLLGKFYHSHFVD